MHVFLAGATGVIGRPLLRRLLEGGHRVTALTRSGDRAATLKQAGAEPLVGDVFERERLITAMVQARPDAVVHQLTALPPRLHPRKIRRDLAATNRIRSEGTANLMVAAIESGASHFIAQSIAFAHRPEGEGLKTETDPLYLDAPRSFGPMIEAIQALEQTTCGGDGLCGTVLRYGAFYGSGTAYAPDGSVTGEIARRRVPIVGAGNGLWPFIHVDDAVTATIVALEAKQAGIYHIVDDEPASSREWIPHAARVIGAKPPFRVPRWLGWLGAGVYGNYMMCDQRGISNARAKTRLGWRPSWPSWRDGFAETMV
jgi:nucleoside-diphosphate-sugar epimerase